MAMLKLETKEALNERPSGSPDFVHRAIVNGILDEQSQVTVHSNKEVTLLIYDERVIQILNAHTSKQISSIATEIRYVYVFENLFPNEGDFAYLTVFTEDVKYLVEDAPLIRLEIQIEAEEWRKPWSLKQFATEFRNQIKVMNDPAVRFFQENEEWLTDGWGMELLLTNDTKICDAIEILDTVIEEVHQRTTEFLLRSLNEESLITFFTFKKGTETVCKQYLVYFAQFLADIGIDAETQIQEEKNQTLFKVIPRNKEDSLKKIKDALDEYLAAAEQPDVLNVGTTEHLDVAAQQWKANIYFLQTQLSLNQGLMAAKDAQIEALKLSNFHYSNQLLLERTKETKTDSEDLVKGIVQVTEYEGTAFRINLPEILRRLKRTFGK